MADPDHAVDPTDPSLPGTEEAPTFHAPWQARAFAIAVALTDDDADLDWQDFQGRLVEMIQSETSTAAENPETVYYRQWLGALERLLIDEGIVEEGEFQARAAEFAAGDRDASEFVAGDRGHDHEHPHDHDHGHSHAHSHDHDHDSSDEDAEPTQ